MTVRGNHLRPKMLTIRPTLAGVQRLALMSARWGTAYFYFDGLRFSASNVERPELQDLWILTTNGNVTGWQVYQMLMEELA
jgi:hypothetical protein